MVKTLIYCFDIDNTICRTDELDYINSKPIRERIERINALYDLGHIINLYTARGSNSGIDYEKLTLKQISEWGLKFHNLYLGKPAADIYIDDKAINSELFEW